MRESNVWARSLCLLSIVVLTACGDEPATLKCPTSQCGFTQISAGYEHTCAIYGVVEGAASDYGQVVCWGENRDGRCGDGSGFGEAQAKRPVVVPNLDDAVAIAAGGTHTCALRATGKLVCWGSNAFGELGNGEDDGSFTPVEAKFPLLAGDIEQVSAGGSSLGGTTCVRDRNQKLWCWGRNQGQQVRPGEIAMQDLPIQIQGVDAATDVTVGQDFVCSNLSGDLYCWGDLFGSAPSAVSRVTGLTAGSLSSKGFMACGHSASDVQCFTNFDDRVSTPIANAQQVAAGAQHACALRDDDSVVCWGSAANGRLGFGNNIDASDPTNELRLTEVVLRNATGDNLNATQIASGASHSCALDSAHDIYCWGNNAQGQIGDGTQTTRSVPTLVQLQP